MCVNMRVVPGPKLVLLGSVMCVNMSVCCRYIHTMAPFWSGHDYNLSRRVGLQQGAAMTNMMANVEEDMRLSVITPPTFAHIKFKTAIVRDKGKNMRKAQLQNFGARLVQHAFGEEGTGKLGQHYMGTLATPGECVEVGEADSWCACDDGTVQVCRNRGIRGLIKVVGQ